MSTSTTQAVLTPEERIALEQRQKHESLVRNVAIAGIIICPAVALMPPRKLDLYTFSLAFGFYLSADHLTTSYTGRGIIHQLVKKNGDSSWLPTEKAKDTQQKLREGKDALKEGNASLGSKGENKGILHRLWMGDEKEGWRERRMEEERKAVEEGKSLTDIILEQIWEVWNWDKKKRGDGTESSSTSGNQKD
ncbi:hypothetical protein B0J11DRAFT_522197 [Dendryphion nanum]|uniref:Uncharacterized protein n=1 Tax=Dendryphion nanum TaxID=256645 RepID=A0A9P9IUA9_9PLEO|nr:hypothetical protein B0J11DRAFT_522197 [Dendryphion nanum]